MREMPILPHLLGMIRLAVGDSVPAEVLQRLAQCAWHSGEGWTLKSSGLFPTLRWALYQ